MKFTELFEMIEPGQLIRVYLPMRPEAYEKIDIRWGNRETSVTLPRGCDLSDFLAIRIAEEYEHGERDSIYFVKTNNNDLKEVI